MHVFYVRGTIYVTPVPLSAIINPNNNIKEVVFKMCALFIDCISEINSTQTDNATYIDVIQI